MGTGGSRQNEVVYEPRGAAKALFKTRSERVLMDGPAGTGKTTAIQTLARLVCEKYPGVRVLFMRETRASMTESVLTTWEDNVLGLDHPAVVNGPNRAHRLSYDFANGSSVVLAGLDQPSKTYSSEYDLVCVFEAIETRREKIELLLRTLRHGKWMRDGREFHQLILDTNPGPATHWLNLAANDGWLHRLVSRHEDNPRYWDAQAQAWTEAGAKYIATLDALTGARRERLRFGRWVSAEGVVYEKWDVAVNLIEAFEPPPTWRRIRSIDFGYTNPFVCQWWAIDSDGRMYLYRELYESGKIVADHAETIKRYSAGERIEVTVADHDAEDRATLHAAGIQTIPAYKAIEHGIQMTARRMVPAGDGKPRLYVMRDVLIARDQRLVEKRLPTCTAEEIDNYVWAKRANGEIAKEVPEDRDNHGMDAMRYAVARVDHAPPTVGAWVNSQPQQVGVSPRPELVRSELVTVEDDSHMWTEV